MEYSFNSTADYENIKELPKVKEKFSTTMSLKAVNTWDTIEYYAQHNTAITSQQVLPSVLVLLQSILTRKP